MFYKFSDEDDNQMTLPASSVLRVEDCGYFEKLVLVDRTTIECHSDLVMVETVAAPTGWSAVAAYPESDQWVLFAGAVAAIEIERDIKGKVWSAKPIPAFFAEDNCTVVGFIDDRGRMLSPTGDLVAGDYVDAVKSALRKVAGHQSPIVLNNAHLLAA